MTSNVGRYAIVPLWLTEELAKGRAAGTTLQVWCAMFEWANYPARELHPSQVNIAERAGVGLTACRDALRRLCEIGALRSQQRVTSNGDPDTNSYMLLLDDPRLRDAPPSSRRQRSPVLTGEGSIAETGEGSIAEATTNYNQLNYNQLNYKAESGSVEATPPQRQRDELFDAVVAACGMDYAEMTKSARRSCAVAVAELRRVGANPLNVGTRAVHYRAHFGDAALTPNALARHWAQCAAPPPRAARLPSNPMMDYVRDQLGTSR